MRKVIALAVLVCCLTVLVNCAKTVTFPVSVVVPAAQAKAKVGLDKNGNALVELTVNHLAPPQNLNPPRSVYVVWIHTPDNRVINLGQLRVGGKLKGAIRGITPFKEFRLVVTAEDDPMAAYPGQQTVLSTGALRAK
ncbi:MAG: hypothetical protein V2A71_07730 [Candidatus Eisenbacteria bacterium]